MKQRIRSLFALLLCALMLLTACNTTPVFTADPTKGSEETLQQSTSASAPKPDGKLLYSQAVEKLKGKSLCAQAVLTQEDAFGKDSKKTVTDLALSFNYYGLENETFRTVATMVNSDMRDETVYIDGLLYNSTPTTRYKMEAGEEALRSNRIPVDLLTPENYGLVEVTETADGGAEIVFAQPKAYEPFLSGTFFSSEAEDPSFDFQLIQVQGKALLNTEGELTENSILVSLKTGRFVKSFELSLTLGAEEAPAVTAPEKAEEFVLVDECGFDPKDVFEALPVMLMSATSGKFTGQSSHSATIWNAVTSHQDEYAFSLENGKQIESFKETINMNVNGEISTYEYEDRYQDGVLSFISNGEKDEAEMSFQQIHTAYLTHLTAAFPTVGSAKIVKMEDAGFAWKISFEFNDSGKAALLSLNMQNFTTYSAEEILDMMGLKELKEDSATATLFISKDDLVPLSLTVNYSGTAPYEGQNHTFASSYYYSYITNTASAEHEILEDEYAPEDPKLPVAPPLYEVTGSNGEKMWLLGTIHVGDERTSYLPAELYAALDASDALAVEYNVVAEEVKMEKDPNAAADYLKGYMYSDGSTAKDHISSELADDFAVWMELFGMQQENPLNLYFLSSHFSQHLSSYDPYLAFMGGVDRALIERAAKASKEILNIESEETRNGTPEAFDDAVQNHLLEEIFELESLEDVNFATQVLYEAWCAGDLKTLEILLGAADPSEDASEAEKKYHTWMETDRNAQMLSKAKEYLVSEQVIFFAVGTAHLFGEDGLVKTLADAGYTVTPVSYAAQ